METALYKLPKKRELLIQVCVAVSPALTEFFLGMAKTMMDQYVAKNPGFTLDQILNHYDTVVAPKIYEQIGKHDIALSNAIIEDHFIAERTNIGGIPIASVTKGKVLD